MADFIEFVIDETRYAVAMSDVLEVSARVLLTPIAVPFPHVLGIFGYRESVAVAVDGRKRLGHPSRSSHLDDHFLILRAKKRTVGLVIDRVLGLRSLDPKEFLTPPIQGSHVHGLIVLSDGLLLIDDLDAVLSLDEERLVDDAIASANAL